MKTIIPGHIYLLNYYDIPKGLQGFIPIPYLTFMERMGELYPGNTQIHPGTNSQEVFRALIDRHKYLNNQIYDVRNDFIITFCRDAIKLLEERAAERHNKELIAFHERIEFYDTCKICGHIICNHK